jgi:hypothetical protein
MGVRCLLLDFVTRGAKQPDDAAQAVGIVQTSR